MVTTVPSAFGHVGTAVPRVDTVGSFLYILLALEGVETRVHTVLRGPGHVDLRDAFDEYIVTLDPSTTAVTVGMFSAYLQGRYGMVPVWTFTATTICVGHDDAILWIA